MLIPSRKAGFALPTVLIAATIMLIVLTSAVAATSAVRSSLGNQYYDQLAREAAESGMSYASSCITKNNNTITWSASKPLTPSSDCSGNPLSSCASVCYVMNENGMRSTFSVGAATVGSDGSLHLSSQGDLQLVRTSDGAVWQTHSQNIDRVDRFLAAPQIGGGAGFEDAGHIGFYLSTAGQLYGFGDNSANQIGGSNLGTSVTAPTLMSLPSGVQRVTKVYTSGQGASIVCIIGDDSQAYCRGKPGAGEVGLMPQEEGWYKFAIPGSPAVKDFTIEGQAADAACALTTAGAAYCAGDNSSYNGTYGALGTGDTTDTIIPISAPQRFILPSGLAARYVYTRDRMTCAITTGSDLYCAGNDHYGTLGDGGSANSAVPIKYPLPGGRKAQDVLGNYHNYVGYVVHVLATDGTIWGSGRNQYGELGNGTATIQRSPVQFGARTDFAAIVTGPMHFCGITTAGDVYCAGDNQYGELGNGTCTDSNTPVKFTLPSTEKASTNITVYNHHQWESTVLITQSGSVYGAGYNQYGKLGNGTNGSGANYQQCTPVKMVLPSGVTAVASSTLDAYTTYILGSNGIMYGVGRNNNGQIGDNSLTDRNAPEPSILPRVNYSY